jgi:hypothetical protein
VSDAEGAGAAPFDVRAVRRSALPGYTIGVEIYGNREQVFFRALALERNTLVLDRGDCRLV